jgi:C1A family cysteine protease
MTRFNGWKRDATDYRDHMFAWSTVQASAFPKSHDLSEHVPLILDQGNLGSCVANSLCYAKMIRDHMSGRPDAPMSRLFAWWHSRNQHGDAANNTGTYIRTCIKVLNVLGRPPETAWPYDEGKAYTKPSVGAIKSAYDSRQMSYRRISGEYGERQEQVKQSISSGMPVVFGTLVSQEFTSYRGGGHVWQAPTTHIVGGHAMCAVGYTPDGVKVVNSWGTWWGDNGYAFISWDAIDNPGVTDDLWSIEL